MRALVLGCIDVGVVEGVDRTAWCDFGVKAPAGRQVADGKLDEVDLGMPEEENLERPTLPLGELASRSPPAGSTGGLSSAPWSRTSLRSVPSHCSATHPAAMEV